MVAEQESLRVVKSNTCIETPSALSYTTPPACGSWRFLGMPKAHREYGENDIIVVFFSDITIASFGIGKDFTLDLACIVPF